MLVWYFTIRCQHICVIYGGKTSDKELPKRSGIIDLLEPEDDAMADRECKIRDLLTLKGSDALWTVHLQLLENHW